MQVFGLCEECPNPELFQVSLSGNILCFQHQIRDGFPMRMQFLLAATALTMAACNGEIYVRDGVTDGDTFYLADRALVDEDPVLQSWVSYSLTKSACQLQIGGDNPARASSFECELMARRLLLQTWSEKTARSLAVSDRYLDELASVQGAGYLGEYV